MNPHEQQGFGSDYRARFNEMCVVARIAAFPITIWTTRFGTWGHRHLTGFALLGMIWLVVFAAFSEQDPRVGELNLFLVLSIGLLVVHRVAGVVRRQRGYRCHSRYWGDSRLDRGTGLEAQRKARLAEGMLVFGIGLLFYGLGSIPLGSFLMIGAAARYFSVILDFKAIDARLDQMEDARIENEGYAELYRERHR
jgi:hypothetical protein